MVYRQCKVDFLAIDHNKSQSKLSIQMTKVAEAESPADPEKIVVESEKLEELDLHEKV